MRVADGRGSTCTVCFEPVNDGEDIFALRCGHRHHQQCLTDWLQRKNECPDCRGLIQREDEMSAPPPPVVVCVDALPLPEQQQQQQQPQQAVLLNLAATGRWSTTAASTSQDAHEQPISAVQNPASG